MDELSQFVEFDEDASFGKIHEYLTHFGNLIREGYKIEEKMNSASGSLIQVTSDLRYGNSYEKHLIDEVTNTIYVDKYLYQIFSYLKKINFTENEKIFLRLSYVDGVKYDEMKAGKRKTGQSCYKISRPDYVKKTAFTKISMTIPGCFRVKETDLEELKRNTFKNKEEERTMKVITITNQKGGVGKTELSKNVAIGLAQRGYRVLVCDGDMQGNLSTQLKINESDVATNDDVWQNIEKIYDNSYQNFSAAIGAIEKGFANAESEYEMADILNEYRNSDTIFKAIQKTKYENVDLIAGSMKLLNTDFKIRAENKPQHTRLSNALKLVADKYDYVVVDTPPSTNTIVVNAIYAARLDVNVKNLVIIPIKNNSGAWEGVVAAVNNVLDICDSYAFDVNVKFLFSMKNRTKNDNEVERIIKKMFKDNVFDTTIRYQACPIVQSSFDKNAIVLDTKFKVAQEYNDLLDEILEDTVE